MAIETTARAEVADNLRWTLAGLVAPRGNGVSSGREQTEMIQTITLAEAYTLRHELARAGKIVYCVQSSTGVIYRLLFPPQRNEIGGWFSVIMVSHHERLSVVRMPGRRPVYIGDREAIEGR